MHGNLKHRLASRELTVGSWLQIDSPVVAEIMSRAGFDWLVVDMEHSAIGIEAAQNLIRVIDLSGCCPLVRLSANDSTLIKRVMDAGSYGIIVPNVCTTEQARAAVDAAHYPPKGNRGVGLWRAQQYGFAFEEYCKWQQANIVVIVQIEHIDGVKNLAEILQVSGVDGFIVGPYDLSASLGAPGEFSHSSFRTAMTTVLDTACKTDALMGLHVVDPDIHEVKSRIAEGYRFVAYSIDTLILGTGARLASANIRTP